MTTPIDPATTIAAISGCYNGAASMRERDEAFRGMRTLASELAEKLREAETSGAFFHRKALTDALDAEERAHAETKRELEQERELVSGCKRTISRFGRVIERLHGFDALAAIVTAVHGACENCDGAGEVISVDTVTHLTCGTCRGSGKKHPPLPACKRCGKPVAHPAQEYCGAACSVERGRAVERGKWEPPPFELPTLWCEITGNPCGTDTWAVGYACDCSPCSEYVRRLAAQEMARPSGKGEPCPGCGGTGWLYPEDPNAPDKYMPDRDCPGCKGSGSKAREGE
ncbi:MAG TPA: hypothetical protein VGK73_32640 [Polyangiaceae bacterium]